MSPLAADVQRITAHTERIREVRMEMEAQRMRCECDGDGSYCCPKCDDCQNCGERKGVAKDPSFPVGYPKGYRAIFMCQQCLDEQCPKCGIDIAEGKECERCKENAIEARRCSFCGELDCKKRICNYDGGL